MRRDDPTDQHQGEHPSDTESLVGDTAASDKLTSATRVQPPESESRPPASPVSAKPPADRDAGR